MTEPYHPASWSERRGNEVYIFVLGQCVMKRWLTGASVTFHVAPSGTRWNTEGK